VPNPQEQERARVWPQWHSAAQGCGVDAVAKTRFDSFASGGPVIRSDNGGGSGFVSGG